MYWLTGILGAASIVAPLIFGYSSNTVALWTSVIAGALLLLVSILEGLAEDRQEWEYVAAMILGVVILAAPFILGFSSIVEALVISVVIGVGVMIAAGTKLTSGQFK